MNNGCDVASWMPLILLYVQVGIDGLLVYALLRLARSLKALSWALDSRPRRR
jgi:hypothetical protein